MCARQARYGRPPLINDNARYHDFFDLIFHLLYRLIFDRVPKRSPVPWRTNGWSPLGPGRRRAAGGAVPAGAHSYERDAYGNEVGVSARRLPVAYLLVDVPCGLAAGGAPTLHASAFPPAHRPLAAHLQTLRALHQHLRAAPTFLDAVSDLHVLLYLATNEALPLPLDVLEPLCVAVRARDAAAADAWRAHPAWATLEQLAAAASSDDEPRIAPANETWTCPHCTYHNPPHAHSCDMCALPR
ncbi:Nuclear protein localization protein 4 homolog [Eumeta japonica]|uniref:Nuclear protein localization protein 4 homolog n=1 Tax=Eumeta variegata TaxID=151549 RepID=A0A4C1XHV0_EUMVA|nr:Nuclear protein localization protein 4 homolog [Eumeta japonica]